MREPKGEVELSFRSEEFLKIETQLRELVDAFKSTEEYRTASTKFSTGQEDPNLEKQLRAAGEILSEHILELLIDEQLSLEEIVLLLHESTTPLWVMQDGDETLQHGEFRAYNVSIGEEVVPPRHEDVQKLVGAFQSSFMKVMESATQEDANLIALWSLIIINAIHPFADGNGRTARKMADYVRKSLSQRFGFEYRPLNYGSASTPEGETLAMVVATVFSELNLFPATSDENAFTSYKARASAGNAESYFDGVTAQILDHLKKVNTVADLRVFGKLALLSSSLDRIQLSSKHKTKSLGELGMAEVVGAQSS
ncbi:MAG: Fic family protein [Candidatus Pacebacteria bacterium]|nr:Fic family protein [Candidatus Paceibacterota bacterium]PIR60425.1 MAG: hypothetical protein COU67_02225 [Candidatus Pacebacteria bacterium CG10_big_fil_rev_8_21_14_0_10_44_54]